MGHAENKLKWCINKAEKEGEKHKGIKVREPDSIRAGRHIAKAEHNFKVMLYLIKGGMLDWAVNASFYSMYHCCLAILAKFGYESRNQGCTFAATETLINDRKISLSIEKLRRISSSDKQETLDSEEIIELREDAQYGTETVFDVKQIQTLRDETIEFLETTQRILQEADIPPLHTSKPA